MRWGSAVTATETQRIAGRIAEISDTRDPRLYTDRLRDRVDSREDTILAMRLFFVPIITAWQRINRNEIAEEENGHSITLGNLIHFGRPVVSYIIGFHGAA